MILTQSHRETGAGPGGSARVDDEGLLTFEMNE